VLSKNNERVAFIGLGVMGYPMAGHLARAGHKVKVFNRTHSKADQWKSEHSGSCAQSPADAAMDADYIFVCVGNDADVLSVVEGDSGVLATLKKGAILVDHTTASAELARNLAKQCGDKGCYFLDAPVSGGQAGAENGQLTIMVGGEEGSYHKAQSLMSCYAKASKLMGPAGAGQLTKVVNQICIAGILQGLAEGLHFAEQAGLDISAVVDTISKGAAQSWQMENRAESMKNNHFDHGFAVDWMRKDLGIGLDAGRKNGARLPLTALVDQFYAQLQAIGGGRWDTSSLIRLLRR